MMGRTKQVATVLVPCTSLLLLLLALLVLAGQPTPACADAGDRYVAVTGDDDSDCTDPTDPCRTVQHAVVEAAPQDVVKVAAGVYNDVHTYLGRIQVLYITETVTVRGGYTTTNDFAGPPDPGTNQTTLDAGGQGRVVWIVGSIAPTLAGLRLTGGDATGAGLYGVGGGVAIGLATATISGCVIYDNVGSTTGAGDGGGLYLENSPSTIRHTRFFSNTASTAGTGRGGAVYTYRSGATFEDSVVISNTASTTNQGFGGGVYVNLGDDTSFEGSTIVSNTASSGQDGYGGGLFLNGSDEVTLEDNTFAGNIASTDDYGYGGGLYLSSSEDATLQENRIFSNTASTAYTGRGGGLYIGGGSTSLIDNRVRHNTASKAMSGYGGGLALGTGVATLQGNTVANNTASTADDGYGGGLYIDITDAALNDNAVTENIASTAGEGQGGGLYLKNCSPTLEGNSVQGNTASTVGDGYGGGLYFEYSFATLLANTVVSNTATLNSGATGEGGGLRIYRSEPFTMTNNLVADNHANTEGSGLWIGGESWSVTSGDLLHNTVADNHSSGQGIYVGPYATTAFTNTIVSGHDLVGIEVAAGGTANLEATLWYGNLASTGGGGSIDTGTINVTGNPAFVDAATWDYHLGVGSAAIDQGIDAGVDGDIDGDARPQGSGYDMGADESICVTGAAIDGPLTGDVGTTYTFTVTTTPATDSTAVVYAWQPAPDSGQGTANAEYTWASGGPHTITVTVSSACDPVAADHTITLCQPPTGATIAGPAAGLAGATYAFTATVAPAGVSSPLAYSWTPEPDSGQGTANVEYAWPGGGLQTIAVTVSNPCGQADDDHSLTLCQPLTGVTVSGPVTGTAGTAYTFAATVAPPGATGPFDYTWTPPPDSGQGTAGAGYTWTTAGSQTLSVTASNCGGAATAGDDHAIEISPASTAHYVFLPLVLRDSP